MTSNEQILDSYIRHQTYLIRYAGGLRNQLLPYLAKTEDKLADAVEKWVKRTNRLLVGQKGKQWQRDFEEVITGIRSPAWDKIQAEAVEELQELAVAEAATGAKIIQGAVPVILDLKLPPVSQLVGIVNAQPFQGRIFSGWIKKTKRADIERLIERAKIGIVQGRTPTEIADEIVGTKAAKYLDGVARKSFRDIESVLITATNSIQNEAKQALYKANADILNKELYVATLDASTTLICASNDGKVFNAGEGPMPSLHFRCRSLRVAYIDPDGLGNRGFDSSTQAQLEREYGMKVKDMNTREKARFDAFARKRRRELVGQVPAKTTYNEWLKKQSNEFQDQVLGKKRAEIFRKGEISLDKFVARDGDTLILQQLKDKGID